MQYDSKIAVLGKNGMVGSAVLRNLRLRGYHNVLRVGREDCDLTSQSETDILFQRERPDYVFLCAAKVGGILANRDNPADFISQNLQIQTNVVTAAHLYGVQKLSFLGSSCIYPRDCPQPIKEEYLLSSKLEPTNRAYAVAKIAGIEMVQSYARQYGFNGICLMPTNLYGINDNFHPESSHVLPAMIFKFWSAKVAGEKEVVCWGSGSPRREFLNVDDCADAAVHLMLHYDSPEIINVGCGQDISIKELAELVAKIVGYEGTIVWDTSKPDGTPRKLLDTSKLTALGWKPQIPLEEGIRETYQWFEQQVVEGALR